MHGGNEHLSPTISTGFQNAVPLRKILETLPKRLSAIQGLGDGPGIHARKLEECMSADGENRRSHLRRVLVQKLIGRDYAHAEFAGFGEHGLDARAVCHEILDFIAVEGEE